MKKVIVLLAVCVAPAAMAQVCDVERGSNGYYTVTRGGQRFSGSYGRVDSAIAEKNKLVASGVCRAIRYENRSCDITRASNGYYVVTRGKDTFSGSHGRADSALELRNSLIRQRMCLAEPAQASSCDIERASNGYYVVTRNKSTFSGSYGSLASAVAFRDSMAKNSVCVRESAYHSSCDVTRASNGYFVVTRDNKAFSGSYGSSSSAIAARDAAIRSGVCVMRGHERHRMPPPRAIPVREFIREVVTPRAPAHGAGQGSSHQSGGSSKEGYWVPKPQ